MTTFKWMAAVLVATVVGSGAWAGDVKANATQQQSMQTTVKNAAGIVGLAYPTAKAHLKTEYVEGTAYKDGTYDLTYKFTYRDSDGKTQSFTEQFDFTARGKLTGHTTVSSTEPWPPFATLTLLGAVVDQIAKEMDK